MSAFSTMQWISVLALGQAGAAQRAVRVSGGRSPSSARNLFWYFLL